MSSSVYGYQHGIISVQKEYKPECLWLIDEYSRFKNLNWLNVP